MGEIKQTNFRVDAETANVFRKFCEENGLNQAQGFDHLIEVISLNNAKVAIPERATEIEDFESHTKYIVSAFLRSIEINSNSENRIKDEFETKLVSKDQAIIDYQDRVNILEDLLKSAESTAKEDRDKSKIALNELAAIKEQEKKTQKSLMDKDAINSMITTKLVEAEKKAEGYDSLKNSEIQLKNKLNQALQDIKDIKKDLEIETAQIKAELEIKNERTISSMQKDFDQASIKFEKTITALEKEKSEETRELYNKITSLQEKIINQQNG